MSVAVKSNALSKLGAHVRWTMEQAGCDPEAAHVVLGVTGARERDRLCDLLATGCDGRTTSRLGDSCFRSHGVSLSVAVRGGS